MTHHADPLFWRDFGDLPLHIQQLARANFELLKRDPRHPSLHFKRIGKYWTANRTELSRCRRRHSGRNRLEMDRPHDEYDRLFG